MLVSVIMAAYDAERWIGEAIESVLAQTYEDWELLVADDGSRDGTVAAVRGYGDPRIRLLEASHAGVLGHVRNRAIEAARGEVIALLDADDAWAPRKLELQLGLLADRPEVGVVHTGAELLVDGTRRPGPAPPGGPLVRNLLANNFIYSSSAAIRRELLDEHGTFDPDPGLRGSPDYELWLRLAPLTEFAYIPGPLLAYRVHGGQMSAGRREMELGALLALEKAAAKSPQLAVREREAWLRACGMRRCLAGLPGRGRRELLGALVRRPWAVATWKWLVRGALPQRSRRTSS